MRPRRPEPANSVIIYANLDALRALAAMLVVLFHLQSIFSVRAGVIPLGGAFGAGNRGVDLFFVLSGFVIMTVHAGDIGRSGRVLPYLYKRACRLFPSVWIVSAAALALYCLHFAGDQKSAKLDADSIMASVLLWPQRQPALVNVTWTLAYELMFYALFALLIASRRAGTILILSWQSLVLAAAAGGFALRPWPLPVWLGPLCLEFGIGMICALAFRSALFLNVARSFAATVAGTCILVAGMIFEIHWHAFSHDIERVPIYGLGSGLLIVGLVGLERRAGWRLPHPIVWLGRASYAVYLVHFSLLSLAAVALIRWRIAIDNASMLACAALATAGGAAFHTLVDQPIQTSLRRAGRRLFGKPIAPEPASSPFAVPAAPSETPFEAAT